MVPRQLALLAVTAAAVLVPQRDGSAAPSGPVVPRQPEQAPPATTAPRVPAEAGRRYRVPYRISDTQHLVVRARVNDQGPFNLIIDTGAPALFLPTDLAEKAGSKADEEGWGPVRRLEIEGGVVLEDVRAQIADPFQLKGMNAMGLAGMKIEGVLGYEILARYRMTINPNQRAMTWVLLDYQPPPLAGLKALIGDKELKKPENLTAMESLAQFASALFARKTPPRVGRGFMGLEVADRSTGVTVTSVLRGSPAAWASLARGDRITAVTLPRQKPRLIKSSADLITLAAGVKAGERLGFRVLRGGKLMTLNVLTMDGGL